MPLTKISLICLYPPNPVYPPKPLAKVGGLSAEALAKVWPVLIRVGVRRSENTIRIISARKATSKERILYEKEL
jgi:hypothetical protein